MIMQCSRLIAEAAAHNTIGTQKRIGIVLGFHPILFKKNQNPAEQKDFVVLQVPEYEDFHLFPDGLSEAVIEVQMVKLNDKGKVEGDDVTEAKAADHSKEGKIVLKVDNKVPGILKYRDQSGAQIEIAVKDLVDGHTTLDKNSPDVVKYVS